MPITTPFAQDTTHASWDREAIARFGRILDWSDSVFEEFSGWFNGKTSPVHLFWHSLDLAVTRFSGRPAPQVPAARVDREAYTHEVISFGFWAGDDTLGDAAYYSYTAPEPNGLRAQPLPVGAWTASGTGSLAILPYETVRTAHQPRATLLAFCQAAYEAGALLAGWDTTGFTSTWCPTPDQLRQLHTDAAADLGRTTATSAHDPDPPDIEGPSPADQAVLHTRPTRHPPPHWSTTAPCGPGSADQPCPPRRRNPAAEPRRARHPTRRCRRPGRGLAGFRSTYREALRARTVMDASPRWSESSP